MRIMNATKTTCVTSFNQTLTSEELLLSSPLYFFITGSIDCFILFIELVLTGKQMNKGAKKPQRKSHIPSANSTNADTRPVRAEGDGLWPRAGTEESHGCRCLRDYAENLKLIASVIFFFRSLKTASQP